MKEKCPCCFNYTLDSIGRYDICPVCYWEDDPLQSNNIDYCGGANTISLSQARKNYKNIGACEEKFIKLVRVSNSREQEKM